MSTLSKNIKRLRKALGLRQEELGELCDCSGPSVSYWEADDTPSLPSLDKLFTLSEIFGVSVDALCTDENVQLGEILNMLILERVFSILDSYQSIYQAVVSASPKQRAFIFSLLYDFCADELDLNLMAIYSRPFKRNLNSLA